MPGEMFQVFPFPLFNAISIYNAARNVLGLESFTACYVINSIVEVLQGMPQGDLHLKSV